MSLSAARSIGLYGPTGGGKTTQIGEYAEYLYKEKGKRLQYCGADMGGYDTLNPHIKAGLVIPVEFEHGAIDPWNWIADVVKGKYLTDDTGAVAFDSATSMGEALMNFITHSEWKVGQQATQKFTVNRGNEAITVGLNNEAHYGLVQTFMLDQIWASTWLVRKGIDIIWTFGEWRGEGVDDLPVIGPAVVGKALTPKLPKWLKYMLRLVSIPQKGDVDRHQMQLTPQPEMNGTAMSMANARWPLKAITPCPAFIEPASIIEFFRLHDQAEKEAEDSLLRG